MKVASDAEPHTLISEQIIAHLLQEQGWTDQEIASIRFPKLDPSLPFHTWSFTYNGVLRPAASDLVRAYAFLKAVAAGEGLGPGNEAAGFRHVAAMIAEPFTELGLKTHARQRAAARKPRGKLANGEGAMGEVITILVRNPEHRDLTARELWPHFLGVLADLGLEPNELNADVSSRTCVQYTPKGDRKDAAQMTLRTFGNRVSKARKALNASR